MKKKLLCIMLMALAIAMPLKLWAQEPYAVLTGDTINGMTVTFYYDNQREARGGIDINSSPIDSSPYGTATTAVIDVSFADYRPTSTAYWFQVCSSLTAITGMENLNTANVTDMSDMFSGCSSLTSLDVSRFNTGNVTSMSSMFSGCSGLTSLDLSGFNTESVRDMSGMFWGCSNLTSLDVSRFNTGNVTSMSSTFSGCSGLTSLDLSGFNTANVTDMGYMFWGCSSMINFDLSGFNTAKVGNMWRMFMDCSSLTNLDLSSFNTGNVANMGEMFNRCSSLTRLDLSNFNTANVTNMRYMFVFCSDLTSLDLSSFNTDNVTDMDGMFMGCSDLTTIYAGSKWSTESVTLGPAMFEGCTSLVGGNGTAYAPDHVDYTYARIDKEGEPGYFTYKESTAPDGEATFDGLVARVSGGRTLDEAFEQAGGRSEAEKTIAAIVWNNETALTDNMLEGITNPNLLVYVSNRSLAPKSVQNVVVDGVAQRIVLTDTGEGNCDFYCPQAFTAQRISYSRSFDQRTQLGVSRGWETITLPFTVQTVRNDWKGTVTPFGNDNADKHFWLKRLSQAGLVSATAIEANVPYIISMPNDRDNYPDAYCINGHVTFSATNAVVPVTEPVVLALADSSVVMYPALQRVERSMAVWTLNVGEERDQYLEGSVFERNYREVRPFEAYTVHDINGPAPRFVPVYEIQGGSATGIYNWPMAGSPTDKPVYDLGGRKVADGQSANGRLPKGVYIQNGRKVVR